MNTFHLASLALLVGLISAAATSTYPRVDAVVPEIEFPVAATDTKSCAQVAAKSLDAVASCDGFTPEGIQTISAAYSRVKAAADKEATSTYPRVDAVVPEIECPVAATDTRSCKQRGWYALVSIAAKSLNAVASCDGLTPEGIESISAAYSMVKAAADKHAAEQAAAKLRPQFKLVTFTVTPECQETEWKLRMSDIVSTANSCEKGTNYKVYEGHWQATQLTNAYGFQTQASGVADPKNTAAANTYTFFEKFENQHAESTHLSPKIGMTTQTVGTSVGLWEDLKEDLQKFKYMTTPEIVSKPTEELFNELLGSMKETAKFSPSQKTTQEDICRCYKHRNCVWY